MTRFIRLLAVGILISTSSMLHAGALYGINQIDASLYEIDPTTGQSQLIGPLNVDRAINDLAYDPTTRTLFGYGTSSSRLLTIDIATGQATPVTPFGAGAVTSIAFDTSTNTMYATQSATAEFLTLDTTNSSPTFVAPFTEGILSALTYDSSRNALFGFDDVNDRFVTIDKETGALTEISLTSPLRPGGVAYDEETDTMFAVELLNDVLMVVNRDTGELSTIGGTGLNGISSLVAIPSIPEPSGLLLGSLGVLAAWAKRQR